MSQKVTYPRRAERAAAETSRQGLCTRDQAAREAVLRAELDPVAIIEHQPDHQLSHPAPLSLKCTSNNDCVQHRLIRPRIRNVDRGWTWQEVHDADLPTPAGGNQMRYSPEICIVKAGVHTQPFHRAFNPPVSG